MDIYITGSTQSTSRIATSGAFSTSIPSGYGDAFIAKFNSSGVLKYGTYFGTIGNTTAYGINVDTGGNIIIVGSTQKDSIIATSGAYQTSYAGGTNVYTLGDAFMEKFDAKGNRIWGTYFGGEGTDYASGISTDIYGNIFMIGNTQSSSGIATKGAYQKKLGGGYDAFLVKFSPYADKASATYFGGKGQDYGVGVAVDTNGNVFITGSSNSDSGISSPGAYQSTYGGGTVYPGIGHYGDAFLARFKTYDNDAGATKIFTNRKTLCSGNEYVTCQINNFGIREIDSVKINWSVSGKLQTSYNWKGKLRKHDSTTVVLGSYSFTPGLDTLICWTSKPNGVTDSLSSNDTAYAIDTVYSHPVPNTGGNHIICTGQSITLGAPRITNHAYAWSSKPAGYSSFYSNPAASPLVTTTYYLTESIPSAGCSTTDSAIITVRPAPKARTGLPKEICSGDTLIIGDSAVSGNIYSWVSVPGGFTSLNSIALIHPASTSLYYLTETDTITGCSKTDSVLITVDPLPGAKVGASRTICRNDTIYLGRKLAISGNSYYWRSSPAGFTSTISYPAVSPLTTTTYYLTETNTTTGCSKTDSVPITVDTIKAEAGSNKTICAGESVTLGSAPNSGYSYSWTSSLTGFTAYTADPVVTPAKTTTYYLTANNTATGCTAKDSVIITVHPKPVVAAYGRAIDVCAESVNTIALTTDTSFTKDTALYTYSWRSAKANVLLNPDKDTIVVGWNQSGTDTAWVTVSNKYGCKDSARFIVTVHALPDAHFSVSSNGDIYTFKAQDSILNHYSWSYGDSATMDTGHAVSHIFGHNRSYKITLATANSFGCVRTYDSTISITASGLAENTREDNSISIYPNPFSNITNIFYTLQKPSQVSIEVLDMQGRKVSTLMQGNQLPGSHSCEFDAGKYNCAAGIYLVKVLIADQVAVRRIVKIE